MYILKKKHLIRIISFFVGFFLVIIGFVFNIKAINKSNARSKASKDQALISNICASVNIIDSSFQKALSLGSFEIEKTSISAYSLTVRNMIFLCNNNYRETALFFLELSDYANTDMQNEEKNREYADFISLLNKNILSECSSNNLDKTMEKIENLFSASENDYDNILRNVEKEYSVLNNKIQANRQEITNYAKAILEMPFAVTQFKGNYIFPKAISYSAKNAYANIFVSGKTLLIMSEQQSKNNHSNNSDISEITINELIKHAPYATDFHLIHSLEIEDIVYYIFCPIVFSNGEEIINYDEMIKLAFSKSDYRLIAFDASAYLKNYPSSPESNMPKTTNTDEKIVIINNQYFIERKTEADAMFYTLKNGKTTKNFTFDEYIKYIS